MPVFRLSDEIIFPPVGYAEKDGLLAVGGDLSMERLVLAYSLGIFPWYSGCSPILWWSPDPRLVLFPEQIRISRSLRQTIKKGEFRISLDKAFEDVVRNCAGVHRKKHGSTWLTEEMIEAYIRLHHAGYAHSAESWSGDELAGGLYGVALGGMFFGESMFTKKSNASKAAFAVLVLQLAKWGFNLIDCQMTTQHLMSFGATEIPRERFLDLLRKSLKAQGKTGKWDLDADR